MGVRPSWSVTLQALHEGTGVWLTGSVAPSMRPWVLSAALKGEKKKSVHSNHSLLGCYQKRKQESNGSQTGSRGTGFILKLATLRRDRRVGWVCVPAIPSGWEQTGNDRLDQV